MLSRLAALRGPPYYPRPKAGAPSAVWPHRDFSMLNSLRHAATSWVAQLLMGILVLSFAVWGISDVFRGFGTNDIAQVGNQQITVTDYQRSYDTAVRGLSAQYGNTLTADQARALGIPQHVLSQLIGAATLDNAASAMGLGISDTDLGSRIVKDPAFADATGAFNRGMMNQIIQQQGFNENDFVVKRRSDYVRGQLVDSLAGGTTAPEVYLRAISEYQTEARTVSYLTLTAPPATSIAEPTDTDLSPYYDANKAKWAAPELRTITYFMASPTDIVGADQISDADAQARYDSDPARWSTAEKRTVQQIVFADQAAADKAAAELAAGSTFDDLVKERNLTPADIDLGTVTKAGIAAPKVADAAFSLAEGATSGVVEGQFGPAIVRVTKIEPSVTTSFEDAKATLKKEIATERAVAQLGTMHDAIEDARAGGATLAEAAAKFNLKIVTLPPVDQTGKDIDGNAVPNVPAGLVAAAFATDVGMENNPIQPDTTSWVWFDVTDKKDSHDRPLADVRDRVVAAWKDDQRQKLLDTKAEAIKSRLTGGEDIQRVAIAYGMTPTTVDKLTRGTTPSGDLSPTAVSDAFAGPKGSVAVAPGALPFTKIVLQVEDVTVPPFDPKSPTLAQAQNALDTQFANDIVGTYLADLSVKTSVRYNDATLNQLMGVGTSAN